METAVARGGRFARIQRTSIGAKVLVAATGLFLFGFLVVHLLGNLLVFQGREAMNSYAAFLESKPALVWPLRALLLAAFAAHVTTALRLAVQSRAARPFPYRREETVQATWASRHMVLTGAVVGAFVVYHLLHYTFHVVPTGEVAVVDGRRDVYGMVVRGFSNGWIVASYVVAQVLLGLHLIHGTKSLFQTLGWRHVLVDPVVRVLAPALALLVAGGNVLIPLAVLAGLAP